MMLTDQRFKKIIFVNYFDIFYCVLSKCITDDLFIHTKKITKNTKNFSIAESKLFQSLVAECIDINGCDKTENELIKIWASMGLLDADDRGNCYHTFTYNKKSIRTVRVKKAAVRLAMGSMIRD